MPIFKMVNGVKIQLTAAEEASRSAQEAKEASRPPPPPTPLSAEEVFDIGVNKGLWTIADRQRPKPPVKRAAE